MAHGNHPFGAALVDNAPPINGMSALGQKATSAGDRSALPPIADIGCCGAHVCEGQKATCLRLVQIGGPPHNPVC